jgi:hypothetical protein
MRLPILSSGAVSEHRDYAYRDRAVAIGREEMITELRDVVGSFRPDLLVYGNTHRDRRIRPNELNGLRQGSMKIMTLLFDTHNCPADDEMEFFSVSDSLVLADSLYAYTRYRLLAEHHYAGKTIIFLPGHQVLPELFPPGEGAKRYDVSHIGTVYGGRKAFIEALAAALPPHRTVSAVGGLFDRTEVKRVGNLVLYDYATSGTFLPIENYARIMRESTCCLSLQTDPDYPRIRGKTFEILASRSLCIVQDIKQYRLVLPPEGFVAVKSAEDAAAKIAFLLDNPDELARRADIGYEWFRDTFDIGAFWRDGLAAAIGGVSPELRNPNARAAYDSLRADLFAHYGGPPSEDSLMKLIFS